jgi:hypothetical protein
MSRQRPVRIDPADVQRAYDGSDAALTRRVLRALEAAGPEGVLAALLFRAQKASTRAKCYRGSIGHGGPRYRDLAYARKGEALDKLCRHLLAQCPSLRWGWGYDPEQPYADWVLYVDLPGYGQVSFHSPDPGVGPDYPGEWDGSGQSEGRILDFCEAVLTRRSQAGPLVDPAA